MDAASRRGELAEGMGTIGVSYRKTAPRGNGAPSRFSAYAGRAATR